MRVSKWIERVGGLLSERFVEDEGVEYYDTRFLARGIGWVDSFRFAKSSWAADEVDDVRRYVHDRDGNGIRLTW